MLLLEEVSSLFSAESLVEKQKDPALKFGCYSFPQNCGSRRWLHLKGNYYLKFKKYSHVSLP